MTKQALLIFSKNPEAGKVKTRLAASIGDEAALSVYRQLLLHTVSITSYLPVDKFVFYSNKMETEDVWENNHYFKQMQVGRDLGEKMEKAFASVFQQGYDKTAIIGTDCIELNASIIMNAFVYLDRHDVVIGPAKDGGYYLLAMKKLHPDLFKEISWSTNKVLEQTLAVCNCHNLSAYLLPELSDIDNEEDLKRAKEQLQSNKFL
ncbi:MAG: TIGR04282 family arsenosugar biosynthesis glycosyltransferase [Flavisolibacter sp.]|jgi:rSAM/selenodomain-associated transferase 1|nr:TIGR04282 family arsenosugar biosynthesis glycosyltransferase [Flavisolibacter sp.]